MKYLELFENFKNISKPQSSESDRNKIEETIKDIFLELNDERFRISIGWLNDGPGGAYWNQYPILTIYMEKNGESGRFNDLGKWNYRNRPTEESIVSFDTDRVKEPINMAIEYISSIWPNCRVCFDWPGKDYYDKEIPNGTLESLKIIVFEK